MDVERTTNRQQDILLAIKLHHRQRGYAPTIRDIMQMCDISSTSVVTYHLDRLREAGMVDWLDGSARTLHLVKKAS